MNNRYQQALDWLHQFANFEQKRIDQYSPDKIDPTRSSRLLALFANPHQQYPTVHIAGTKGKGSVAAMCAFVLRAAGLRVGLYTSPHLVEFRERFRILTPDDADGRIPPDQFADIVDDLKPAIEQIPGLTWFELVTAVAFLHFARQQVDVAVIEVGLGGRLDATNIITPLVSVITSLSLDHTDLLGDTLSDIAYEKGGIIKPGVPVVVAPQKREALDRLQAIAAERNAPLTAVGETWRWESPHPSPPPQGEGATAPSLWEGVGGRALTPYALRITQPISLDARLPLSGEHQRENGVTAVAALKLVQPHFPALTDAAIQRGLAEVVWPGRLQIVHQSANQPTLLADCAHNADSAHRLAAALRDEYQYARLWLLLGVTADKDVSAILAELLPLAPGRTAVTQSSHPRAATPARLRELAETLGYTAALMLETGVSYEMEYQYRILEEGFGDSENFAVWLGTAQNSANMTEELHEVLDVSSGTFATGSANFTVASSGQYYLGLYSAQNTGAGYGQIDDVIVRATAQNSQFYNVHIAQGTTAFAHNLVVENDLIIDLGASLTVEGTVVNNGRFVQTSDVPGSGVTSFLHIQNAASDEDKYMGVVITPTLAMGETTVQIRGNQDCTTNPASQPVRRCFDIEPTNHESATIRFYYLPAEANGNPESSVSVYHWNAVTSTWDLEGGGYTRSSSEDPHWVQVTDVSNYSPFVLDNVTPTAVTLQSLTAMTAAPMLLIILIVVSLTAGTAVALRRRHTV